MPALMPTSFVGKLVWLGSVKDQEKDLRSEQRENAQLAFSGMDGEFHGGLTRLACIRTVAQYPAGTEIRNVRQLSVLSKEELDAIAADMEFLSR